MQQVKKIIPQVKMNPKHKKYIDSWHNEVNKYDWDNMDEYQYRKAARMVLTEYKKNLTFSKRTARNFVGYVFLFGLFTIIFLMFITLFVPPRLIPFDWDNFRNLLYYFSDTKNKFKLIYTMFWLVVITFILNWFLTDRFYRREQKNLQNYLNSIERAKGIK